MILFFDTETTGKPKDYKAPMTQLDNWPRVIQLAWSLCDLEGNAVSTHERLIKPDCWEIPAEPFWIEHGFSTEKSKKEGVPLSEALNNFLIDLHQADYLVAHNLAFDHPVLGAELLRYEMKGKICKKICTMEATVDFCAIPFFKGQREWLAKKNKSFKWPKLEELYQKLFNADFPNKHQAGGDVAALRVCFFELVARGIIKLDPINAAK